MFSTLLSTVQTAFSSLISKSFFISSIFPVCIFLAAMALVAKAAGITVVLALFKKDSLTFQNTLTFSLLLTAILTLAYVLSSLATVMLESLEGRHLPSHVRSWLHAGQHRRLIELNAKIAEAREEGYSLKFDTELKSATFDPAKLDEASVQRPKIQTCDYPTRVAKGNARDLISRLERNRNMRAILPQTELESAANEIIPYLLRCNENENSPAGRALKKDHERLVRIALPWAEQLKWATRRNPKTRPCVYPPTSPTHSPHAMIENLELLRERGDPISRKELQRVFYLLLRSLLRYDENEGTPSAELLSDDRKRFLYLVNYARDRRKSDFLRLSNEKQFNYPGEVHPSFGRSSINMLAPTQFGNIGRTMRSYALTRYSLDLDLFWTRLQRTMQNTADKFYQVMQETKAQVDCFVALAFLSVLFTGFWTVYFISQPRHPFLFLAIGFVGPLVTYASYRLPGQSYSVFADLVRAAVDGYRFGLLTDLHITQPFGTREEELIWELLGVRTGYDSKEPLIYSSPK